MRDQADKLAYEICKAVYIKNLKNFKDGPKILGLEAAQAQKTADYIIMHE